MALLDNLLSSPFGRVAVALKPVVNVYPLAPVQLSSRMMASVPNCTMLADDEGWDDFNQRLAGEILPHHCPTATQVIETLALQLAHPLPAQAHPFPHLGQG